MICNPRKEGNGMKSEHTVFPTPFCLLTVGYFTVHIIVFLVVLVK